MKSLFIILFFGIAYANAQGTEFLVDNLVNPFIDNVNNNLQNYLIGQLLGSLGNILFGPKTTARPILVGKREQQPALVNEMPEMIKGLINTYVQKLKQIARNFIQQIHNVARPIFDALLAEASNQIQNVSHNLTGQLFSVLQSKFNLS